MSAPPQCSNLTATDDVAGIKVAWDLSDPVFGGPSYLAAYNCEVWAASTNDRASAAKVGEGWTDFSHQGLARGATRFYWVRPYSLARSADGTTLYIYHEWFPESATAGVQGTELSGDVLIATNGYWKHPSGLIEQWGIDVYEDGDTIPLPIAFPNSGLNLSATLVGATPNRLLAVSWNPDPDLAADFLIFIQDTTGAAQAGPVFWRALGY